MAWKELRIFCCKSVVEYFWYLDYFQNGSIYYIWGFDVIKFLNPKPEESQIFACQHIVDLHKQYFSWTLYHFLSSDLGFTMILIFFKILHNSFKKDIYAAILKIIKISTNFHGRFTAKYPKFLSTHLIKRKCEKLLHPPF